MSAAQTEKRDGEGSSTKGQARRPAKSSPSQAELLFVINGIMAWRWATPRSS